MTTTKGKIEKCSEGGEGIVINPRTEFISQVKEFHNLFNQPVLKKPEITKNRIELRIELLREELKELEEALNNDDKVETLDALCDLQYVLSGAILEFGMQDIFLKAFNNVHQSNMSKACKNEQELEDTVKYYTDKGIEIEIKEKNNKFLVYRKSDNKVLKNFHYKKCNMNQFLS